MPGMTRKRVAFFTLGCKANWSDTEALSQACQRAGLDVVRFDQDAEAYVVNGCAVTSTASAQSRQMLRRARRRGRNAIVVAAGCCGQIEADELGQAVGADAVFGTGDRAGLLAYLCGQLGGDVAVDGVEKPGPGFDLLPLEAQSRARAFLKIQDGCARSCAYCIVPAARGRARSLPVDDVVGACKQLSRYHREIILSGIDIGQYGRDLGGETGLADLLERLVGVDDMARLRLSTLDPTMVDDRLIRIIADSGKICRHVHLSIQSGSDKVLRRMRRGYMAEDVKRVALALARAVPGIAITGDVMAGFPGEDEEDHLQTVGLLESSPLAGFHVFPFSVREGTRAAGMPDQVPWHVRRARAAKLRDVAAKSRHHYLQGLVGQTLEVIVTSSPQDGQVKAVADNAVSVQLPTGEVGYSQLGWTIVTDVSNHEVKGIWSSPEKTRSV